MGNAGDFYCRGLRKFQQAVQSYDGDIKKFYVTPRDLSPSYSFEEDMENKVLAVITPDTILQDDYIQAVRNEGLGDYLQPEEKADSAEAPAFDIGMGYLGNGLTVWNRAVEENGDYQTIAHISDEGESTTMWTVCLKMWSQGSNRRRHRNSKKRYSSAAYKVGDRVYLDGKPFEITRVDDWNVELMDRSEQNPQPRLEQKDSFMRLVQQNERSSFTDADDARRRGISSVHSRQVFPVVSGHSDILLSFRPVLHRNVRVQLSRGAGTDCDDVSGVQGTEIHNQCHAADVLRICDRT